MSFVRKPAKPKNLKRPKGVVIPTKTGRPCCKGCGYEFKLLTAMGIKYVDMYCLQCEAVRKKLGKQIEDWEALDARVKAQILPSVKGFSWPEQMGRTL